MKKKLVLLGTVLAISAVSAQAVFAANPHGTPQGSVTATATASQLDLTKVKLGEAKAIGPLSGTYAGATTLPAPVAKATLTASNLDPSAVQKLLENVVVVEATPLMENGKPVVITGSK